MRHTLRSWQPREVSLQKPVHLRGWRSCSCAIWLQQLNPDERLGDTVSVKAHLLVVLPPSLCGYCSSSHVSIRAATNCGASKCAAVRQLTVALLLLAQAALAGCISGLNDVLLHADVHVCYLRPGKPSKSTHIRLVKTLQSRISQHPAMKLVHPTVSEEASDFQTAILPGGQTQPSQPGGL